jgi:hypothetical protein
MNTQTTSLSAPELRNILIEESKKFNAAIQFGSSISDMEEIQIQIKQLEELLQQKENGEFPQLKVAAIPLNYTNPRI